MHTVFLRGQHNISGVHYPEVYEVSIIDPSVGWRVVKSFNNPREAYRFCNYLNGGTGTTWDGE